MISLAACGGFPATESSVRNASAANVTPDRFYYAPNVRRACAAAQGPDEMTCLALVRTDIPAKKRGSTPAGYGPSDLQSAYNLPSATAGSGQTVAVVDAFDNPSEESDLAVYRSTYGLPPCGSSDSCFQKVNEEGQAYDFPPPDDSWGLEESLDVEMVSAICPNCHIVLVEANTSHTNDLGKSVNTAVDIMHANVISNSYIRYNVHGKMGRMFTNTRASSSPLRPETKVIRSANPPDSTPSSRSGVRRSPGRQQAANGLKRCGAEPAAVASLPV
jgi:hypothetical protein